MITSGYTQTNKMALANISSLRNANILRAGKPLPSSSKCIILNVYMKIKEENSKESVNFVSRRTADLTGVSIRTVFNVTREAKTSGSLKSPGKKKSAVTEKGKKYSKYDEFVLCAIRKKIHDMFRRNEIPTLQKVKKTIDADDQLPDISQTSLWRILKKLGFVYTTRKRNAALIERDDIIAWRRRYLRYIKQFRNEGRHIYYTDETWVNAGHTKNKTYHDTTIRSARQAILSGLTTGLKAPTGKGSRLIVTHAGSEGGFVNGALEVFQSSKSTDYHDEMDGNHYENWFFNNFLPNIEPNSVVVLDNAPYHSVRTDKIPTQSSRKVEIQKWLTEKNISWRPQMLKAELLMQVSQHKQLFQSYSIDKKASELGHTILRLPPYHCELNPIELIWSQIKGYVASNNKTFKLAEVKELTLEAINQITADNWKKCVDHVKTIEKNMWQLDEEIDNVTDRLQLTITGSSQSETDTADEDTLSDGVDDSCETDTAMDTTDENVSSVSNKVPHNSETDTGDEVKLYDSSETDTADEVKLYDSSETETADEVKLYDSSETETVDEEWCVKKPG